MKILKVMGFFVATLLSPVFLHEGLRYSVLSLFETCEPKESIFKQGEFEVSVTHFLAKKASAPSVIIMPPTGGTNYLDIRYATSLCSEGVSAHIINSWSIPEEGIDLNMHQRFYESGQKAIELVMDELGEDKFGILGTSIGGLHAVNAVSLHPRIQSGMLVTWGGPHYRVISRSTQQAMVDLKAARFKEFGYKEDSAYEADLSKAISYDPFVLPKDFKGKKLGMVLATDDQVVPTELQKELIELWKPSQLIEVNGAHKAAIIKTFVFHSREVVSFFKSL